MRLFIDDILKIDWLVGVLKDVKSPILNISSSGYVVIYYKYEEYSSNIIVEAQEIRYVINEDIYRKLSSLSQSAFVGYFKPPFETNNYLFYSYLLSCIKKSTTIEYADGNKRLNQLFLTFRAEDKKKAKEKSENSIKGVFPINSAMSLSSALDEIFYVNKKPLSGLNLIFDMLKSYYQKSNVNFYGDVLKSFVRLVKNPNGGIIPQQSGNIRYLIIGEKVAGDDEDLKKAKEQLRQNLDYNTIFLNTGWFYNKYDNKWRKNIPDGYFSINESVVTFSPNFILSKSDTYSGTEQDLYSDLKDFNKNKISFTKIILDGYNNKLGDIFKYPEAYERYPKLKEIYGVIVGGKDGEFKDSYYYSRAAPERIVLVRGNVPIYRIPYIVLHEVQHYIQRVEGFGNGGNRHLAEIINAVGGSSTKMFLNTMTAFVNEVYEKADIIDVLSLQNHIGIISADSKTPSQVSNLVKLLQNFCTTNVILKESASDFAYTLLHIYTFLSDKKRIVTQIVEKYFQKEYIDLFEEALKQSQAILLKNQSLIAKGWTPNDISILNFQTYEALMGETESRFVQNTSKIDAELRDYFALYSAETIDPYKITVINESEISEAPQNIKAAIETDDGSYIIHLTSQYSNTVNILHEVGHIIYDILVDVGIVNPLDPKIEQEAIINGYMQSEEYICDSFVDYVQRKNFEAGLTEDMNEERKITNYNTFDKYFDSILLFNPNPIDAVGIKRRTEFVKMILKSLEDGN